MINYNPSNETNIIYNPDIDPRNIRNKLLEKVDRVNPIWYATLTSTQQTELATYRKELLDVPQQSGFPNSILWPSPPAWLG